MNGVMRTGLTKFTLFETDDVMYKNTPGILTRIQHAPDFVWRESQFRQELTVSHQAKDLYKGKIAISQEWRYITYGNNLLNLN